VGEEHDWLPPVPNFDEAGYTLRSVFVCSLLGFPEHLPHVGYQVDYELPSFHT
jgi:hypothetical protein